MASVDWTTILSVLAAGGLGVVAALVGNRYLRVLEVRGQHHADLNDRVLAPWDEQAKALENALTWQALGAWIVGVDYEDNSWEARYRNRNTTGEWPSSFPPRTPLWDKTVEHWPALHQTWGKLEDDARNLADKLVAEVNSLAEGLAQFDADVKWQWEDVKRPGFGRRLQARDLFRWLMEEYLSPNPPDRRFTAGPSTGASDQWPVKLGGADFCIARSAKAQARLVKHLTGLQQANDRKIRAVQCLKEATDLQKKVVAVLADLERYRYDRNLAGRCAFCPRMWKG